MKRHFTRKKHSTYKNDSLTCKSIQLTKKKKLSTRKTTHL